VTAQTPDCLGEQGKLKWLLWEGIGSSRVNEFIHYPSFPDNPDAFESITGLKSPGIESQRTVNDSVVYSVYYATSYGSLIRGYLTVPATGNYSFNITGDDESQFLLSSDTTRENLDLKAFVHSYTYRDGYNKELNQTSALIPLQTGTYYYFEVRHKEGGGGDHVQVKWKTPSNMAEWQVIPSDNLYDYDCPCAPSGTACNDGNPNTVNDKEDGSCNCVGTPTNKPSCVGEQGEIRAFYYYDLDGSHLSTLYNAEKYPLMPDTVEMLDLLRGPLVNRDTYGTRIVGYLKVPVTGKYQFTSTCSDRASFKLSTTNSPDDLVEVSYSSWTSTFDYFRYESQTSDSINLNRDTFYYFELTHKEGSGWDNFNIFWRTPFATDTTFRYIDKAYIYGYNCEMACIPEGTACDDNNNFTKNDQYDANCNCVGTPCRGAECDETPQDSVQPTAACGIGEKIENSAPDAWESCTPSANPNSSRGLSHWIRYDLGKEYLISESHIWNYNVAGGVGKGFKDVVIDYSTDGNNWTQLGDMYQWQQASGTIGYAGFAGPNFNGIRARYILITALNNWDNGACSGFSKITFNATDCLLMGQDCDDGDANSIKDKYDAHCNCVGEGVGYGPCGTEALVQGKIDLSSSEYRATATIVSEARVAAGTDVKLLAGTSITLMPGFAAAAGSDFLAKIEACTGGNLSLTEEAIAATSRGEEKSLEGETSKSLLANLGNTDSKKANLLVAPNPTNSWTSFHFNIPYRTEATLCIYAADGRNVNCLISNQSYDEGVYFKEFPAQRLSDGMYYVVLKTNQEIITKPFVVLE
jgi:hypothetical protein